MICPEILSQMKKNLGAQLKRVSEWAWNNWAQGGPPLPWELGVDVCHRADLAAAAVVKFNEIICAFALPASGWFQPGSCSCCVAEHRRNDGEKGHPCTLKHSSGVAASYSPACYSRVNFWHLVTFEVCLEKSAGSLWSYGTSCISLKTDVTQAYFVDMNSLGNEL